MLASIRDYAGPRLVPALIIVTLGSIVEGAGLILLLPIADLAFSGASSNSPVAGIAEQLFASLGLGNTLQQLAFLCIAFLFIILLRAVILLRRDALLSELSQGYVDHFRKEIFAALANAEWTAIKRVQRAHLLDNMTTNIARMSLAVRFISQAGIMLVMVVIYLASGFIVHWGIGLLLAIISGIAAIAGLRWSRRSRRLGEAMTKSNRFIMDEMTRFLDGLKTAKAYQAGDLFARRFNMRIDAARAVSVQFVRQQGRMRRIIEMIGACTAVILLLSGYGLLSLSGAELLVMGAIVIRLMPGLLTLFSGMQSISYALPAFTAAQSIRKKLEDAKEDIAIQDAGGTNGLNHNGAIKLTNIRVSAMSDSADTQLLYVEGITLPAHGLIHVEGPSGAGKSTFAELIAGLQLASAGTITIGDVELSKANRVAWQSQIAFVPQEPFLFAASVRENLCWPNAEVTEREIWVALEAAAAGDLVKGLSDGLDHALQDGGNRLSGGERQRLCLARALLRPSSILIVDEATSAVDSAVEGIIVKNLAKIAQRKPVILISHSAQPAKFSNYSLSITQDGHVIVQE
nr:ABC transporter ATP-binding protein [Sphingorhabdus sp. Alg239-R122]